LSLSSTSAFFGRRVAFLFLVGFLASSKSLDDSSPSDSVASWSSSSSSSEAAAVFLEVLRFFFAGSVYRSRQ